MKSILGSPMYYAKFYTTSQLQNLLRVYTIQVNENKERLKDNKLYFVLHTDIRKKLKNRIKNDEVYAYGIARAIEMQLDYFDTTGKQLWAD